jgi:glutamyl-tRNA synthetase
MEHVLKDTDFLVSQTDSKGKILFANEDFCKIAGYTLSELVGNPHNMIRHKDMPKWAFEDLWRTIKAGQIWKGEIKNIKKDGTFYWVESIVTPKFLEKGRSGYIAIRQDITAKKEVEEFKKTLEIKVEERTNDLNDERNFVNSIMNTQDNFLVVTDGKKLKLANNSMLKFYDVKDIEEFINKIGSCICDTFNPNSSDEFIKKNMNNKSWIEYIYENKNHLHKVLITKDGKDYTFTITADRFTFKNAILSVAVFTDITELEETRKEVEKILANILLPVLITSKEKRNILYANKYAEFQYEKSTDEIIGSPIDDVYTIVGQHHHIIEAIKKYGMIENMEESFKTSTGKEFDALLSVTPITYQGEDAYIGMVTDITKQKKVEKEIRDLHKHTRDSIKYAALIQHSIIPSNDLFKKYFSEYLVIWHPKDIVGGEVIINSSILDDKVLYKSADELPTYHLANIVDDHLMDVSHVIRGEEWLPSAPLHVLLYRAFGWEETMPQFAHLPLLLKPDGNGKLSKRDGDRLGFPVFPLEWKDPKTEEISSGYREAGYLPEAVINFLALLGWNPGNDQEIMSMDELIQLFDLHRCSKAGAKFDYEKGKWFNHQYIQLKSNEEIANLFIPYLKEQGVEAPFEKVVTVVGLMKERVSFVKELWDVCKFFFVAPTEYDEKTVKKRWKEDSPAQITELMHVLEAIEDFSLENQEKIVMEWIENKGYHLGNIMNAFRLTLVGEGKGPHMFDISAVLGKEETIARMKRAIEVIKK